MTTEDVGRRSSGRTLAPRPETVESSQRPISGRPYEEGYEARTERSLRRRRVACQQCRQSKLRCEGSSRGNRPCQRCSELERPCVFDSAYKRVSKRTTLNDLASHVELLKAAGELVRQSGGSPKTDGRQTIQQGSAASPQIPLPLASSDPALDLTHLSPESWARPSPVEQFPINPEPAIINATALPTPLTLENVKIDPRTAQRLFKVYFTSYHPSFPILHPSAAADSVYRSSRFLFWTIITVAARHDNSDFSLLQDLVPAAKALLWSSVAIVPHTLPSLQAMAILCVWPFPVSSMPVDNTFLLAGILKSAATHVGLHRPENLMQYSRVRVSLSPADLTEARRVWCCIFIAVDGVTSGNGNPPYFASDRTIEQASTESNSQSLPQAVHRAVSLQLLCNQVHIAMSDCDRKDGAEASAHRIPMLKIWESELQSLGHRLEGAESHHMKMYYLSTCFQVRAYWLFNDEDTVTRREGVVKAFASASRYIKHLDSGDKSGLPVRYLRFLDLRICFTAAIFISKVIHSSYRHFVDEEHGKEVFSTAISFFKNSTVEDNDMNGRSTKVLAQLWSIHKNLFDQSPQRPPRISLKSRLLFSIAHDGLWQWREKYAGQPSNGAPDLPPPLISPAETSTLEDRNSLDEHGASPSKSVPQPTAFGQSGIGLDASNGSSFLRSSNFSGNDLINNEKEILQQPEGEFEQQTGLNGADAMNFDLLFPDFDMGYTTQDWP